MKHNELTCTNPKCGGMHWLRMESKIRAVFAEFRKDPFFAPTDAVEKIATIIGDETKRGYP